MGEKFGYILLILQVFAPNGIKTNMYFGPFNSEEDAEEWSEDFGVPLTMFNSIKMIYPDAIYAEAIT